MRVFARRGIEGARHTDVAREAQVAVSTTFSYFPKREDLVGAVLDEVERLLLELATAVHASDRPAPELLRAHTTNFAAMVDDHPDEVQVWLSWSSAVRADTWPRYCAFEARVTSLLEATIARGQREGTINGNLVPSEVARIGISSGYTIALMKLSRHSQDEVERFINTFVKVLAIEPASGYAA